MKEEVGCRRLVAEGVVVFYVKFMFIVNVFIHVKFMFIV